MQREAGWPGRHLARGQHRVRRTLAAPGLPSLGPRRLRPEILAVDLGKAGTFDTDEAVRHNTEIDRLARLRPVFRADGVATAGNASPLSDGASSVIVASEEAVSAHGLRPRAHIVG